jgi:hypothetical protein
LLVGGREPRVRRETANVWYNTGRGPEGGNLRESKREQAAMRKPAPAKKAPAKTAAKPAPKKAAAEAATPKLRWTLLAERSAGNRAVPQAGSWNCHTWTIEQADGGWNVVHTDPNEQEDHADAQASQLRTVVPRGR